MCTKYDTYLATAIELAYQAGEIAQQANKSQLEIRHKRDSSPVTSVDKQLNNFICSVLEKKFPKVRVVGEETSHDHNANEPFEKGLCFFVDPIDGTKNYIRNNGDWCIMIGLVNKGIPVMGVVYHPEKDTMYYAAKGKGAFCIEKKGTKPRRLKAIDTDPIDSICVLSPSDRDDRTVQLANTLGIKQFSDIGSLGLKCCLLADGKANLYVNFKKRSSYWDACAPYIIMTEAGVGPIRDSTGKPLMVVGTNPLVDFIVFAATPKLVPKVVECLKKFVN